MFQDFYLQHVGTNYPPLEWARLNDLFLTNNRVGVMGIRVGDKRHWGFLLAPLQSFTVWEARCHVVRALRWLCWAAHVAWSHLPSVVCAILRTYCPVPAKPSGHCSLVTMVSQLNTLFISFQSLDPRKPWDTVYHFSVPSFKVAITKHQFTA